MAGGRRGSAKSSVAKIHHSHDDRGPPGGEHMCNVVMPKHIPLPDLAVEGELTFELNIFHFALMALTSQYVNLYRSVWWLPKSYNNFTMNFYLIDIPVSLLCLMVIGRKLPFLLLQKFCTKLFPTSWHASCNQFLRIFTAVLLVPTALFLSYIILMDHGLVHLCSLLYPFVIYFLFFGPTLGPLLELPRDISRTARVGTVFHTCSPVPRTVREEVETLKADFNCRMKHALINTIFSSYYSSFLPTCFIQKQLHYSPLVVYLHVGFVALTFFMMLLMYCFTPRYLDIFHRSALHLGRWQRVEPRNLHIPYSIWSDSMVWGQGSLVKHMKELFRAEWVMNAAEPGNSFHNRFYTVFHDPRSASRLVLGLQILVHAAQIATLSCMDQWHHLLSLGIISLYNFPLLYRACLHHLVLRKAYNVEAIIQGATR